jgi:hypothetical protein
MNEQDLILLLTDMLEELRSIRQCMAKQEDIHEIREDLRALHKDIQYLCESMREMLYIIGSDEALNLSSLDDNPEQAAQKQGRGYAVERFHELEKRMASLERQQKEVLSITYRKN